ncbi:hypothetical protein [Kineococcus sp. R86509]|uniref:hypothetical protein n=1 Tax=Kineococcus sp. R86509 TaxID=3093851 RepID=UPI0036D3FD1A
MRTWRFPAVGLVTLPVAAACSGGGGSAEPPAPDTRGWTALPAPPVRAPVLRRGQAAVWTGTEALVWGGLPVGTDGCSSTPQPDGAAWDPGTTTWTAMAPSPIGPRQDADLLWTGSGAVLVGGRDPLAECESRPGDARSSALFTPGPAGGRWTRLPDLPWPADAAVATSAWAGDQVLVWSPAQGGWSLRPGDPAWTALPAPAAEVTRPGGENASASAHSVWTGAEWMVWSSETSTAGTVEAGLAFDPATGAWRDVAVGPVLVPGSDVVWTGTQVLAYDPLAGALAYDPSSDRWHRGADGPIPLLGSGTGKGGPVVVWAGTRLLVWGGARERDLGRCTDGDGSDDHSSDYGGVCNPATGPLGAAYDPAADEWTEITDGPWPRRTETAAVWTGRELLLAGGIDLEVERGGRPRPYPDVPAEAVVTFTPPA